MFKFNRILNATTGIWYYIDSARLTTDEYDWTENGGNAFTVDLQPLTDEGFPPVLGLTLSVSNNGTYAMITKNLNKKSSTHKTYSDDLKQDVIREDMQDCIIDGNTLIVCADISSLMLAEFIKDPPETAEEFSGCARAAMVALAAEGNDVYEITETLLKIGDAAGLKLPDSFLALEKVEEDT